MGELKAPAVNFNLAFSFWDSVNKKSLPLDETYFSVVL
jgi:hypothetical protein